MEIEDIIQNRINKLIDKVKKQERVDLLWEYFDYEFMSRVEFLAVDSDRLYPEADLPTKFGVQRGYNGGGMHSGLTQTEVYRLPKRSQAKAERILSMFADTFRNILADFDVAQEEATGEPVEIWNSATL